MTCYIGIDIGTYESKGVLVKSTGEILFTYSVPHEILIPQKGWAEHDAHGVWWGDTEKIIHECVKYVKRTEIDVENIRCIGVSTIAPSVVPIDKHGEPLRNGILYGIDTRTSEQIEKLNVLIGENKIRKISKQALTTQAGGPKILWIKENEPDNYKKTKYFLSGAGYLGYKLTGEIGIDHYTAASFAPLYDFEKNIWSKEMISYITETEKLPKLFWSTEILGNLTSDISEKFGLSRETSVLIGTTDALAEAISCGSVNTGDLMLMYGSSTFFILNTKEKISSANMWPNLHATRNFYSLTGGTATAGSLTRWFIDQFDDSTLSTDSRYEKYSSLAEQSLPGANGCICLPYFSGERTPINNPEAKGVFFGLTLKHTKGDLYRAVLEGVGYSIRQNIEYMNYLGTEITRIISIGGGTKNKIWLQIVSDICGVEQIVTKNKVGASYGNAFLCSIALGHQTEIKQIEQWLETEDVIRPNPHLKLFYDDNYKKYCELYSQLEHLM